jgi:hypothetical protein
LGTIVAVIRLGTPTAAGTTGSEVVVGVVVAAAGVAETVRKPHSEARPTPAVIRARRMPPPISASPAWREVYGAAFLRAKGYVREMRNGGS